MCSHDKVDLSTVSRSLGFIGPGHSGQINLDVGSIRRLSRNAGSLGRTSSLHTVLAMVKAEGLRLIVLSRAGGSCGACFGSILG